MPFASKRLKPAPFVPFARPAPSENQSPLTAWGSLKGSLLPLRGLPVRQRHVLTRRGGLRLRYVVLPSLALLLLGGGMTVAVTTGLVTLGPLQMASADDANFVPATIQDAEDQAEADDTAVADTNDTVAAAPAPVAARPAAGVQLPGQIAMPSIAPAVVAAATAPPVPAAPPRPVEKVLRVGKGDTLNNILLKGGLNKNDAALAALTLKPYYNPRSMNVGQKVTFRFDPIPGGTAANGAYGFTQLAVETGPLSTVQLKRTTNGGMQASLTKQQAVEKFYARHANIDVSLYGSALKAHIPSSIVSAAIRIYSWNVDFQRELQPGDVLDVMYDGYEAPNGQVVRTGDIVYARLKIGGRDIPIYRYQTKDGGVDYYTADGHSIRKALLSTPVDGARVSSGFGLRIHPVLGFTKMHKGIDFAAPIGTPIYAAGNGVIEKIGPFSTYGNYIKIKHNKTLETAYAHISRFVAGLRDGDHVHQGQMIAYVGETGRATGPHLHYEVIINGNQVNPAGVKVQSGEALAGRQLAGFKAYVADLGKRYSGAIANHVASIAPVGAAGAQGKS